MIRGMDSRTARIVSVVCIAGILGMGAVGAFASSKESIPQRKVEVSAATVQPPVEPKKETPKDNPIQKPTNNKDLTSGDQETKVNIDQKLVEENTYREELANKVAAAKEGYKKDQEEKAKQRELASRGADDLLSTYNNIKVFLDGTKLQGLETSICSYGIKYGVDPYFIAAVAVHESDWGKSRLAQNKNNLFGLNAQDDDPYNKAFTFAKKEDAVQYFSSMISDKYSDMTVERIAQDYASDPGWPNAVRNLMDKVKTGQKLNHD